MIARLLIILALVLTTLPVPVQAAAPCHEAAAMEMAMPGMAHDMPASEPDMPHRNANMLCVGCIAPATLRFASVGAPVRIAARLASTPYRDGLFSAGWQPEPPPPRG